jgi:hypothetical protein
MATSLRLHRCILFIGRRVGMVKEDRDWSGREILPFRRQVASGVGS